MKELSVDADKGVCFDDIIPVVVKEVDFIFPFFPGGLFKGGHGVDGVTGASELARDSRKSGLFDHGFGFRLVALAG